MSWHLIHHQFTYCFYYGDKCYLLCTVTASLIFLKVWPYLPGGLPVLVKNWNNLKGDALMYLAMLGHVNQSHSSWCIVAIVAQYT